MLVRPNLGGRTPQMQIRAGKMTVADGQATADPRSGVLSIVDGSYGLVEVWWSAAGHDESTIVNRGDATVERVERCTTGRVFALCLGGRRDAAHTRLFWLQEPAADRDEQLLRRFKALIGERAAPAAATATATTAAASAPPAAAPVGAQAAAAPAAQQGAGRVTSESLQAIIQSLNQGQGQRTDIDLRQLLSGDEVLSAIREDPAFYTTRVAEHLPECDRATSDVAAAVRNPQATAAAATLQAAIVHTPGALQEVCRAFGLPLPPATTPPSAVAFLDAVAKGTPKGGPDVPPQP